ncbi:serine/threonine-protein phosphatase 4 regulatory subunit 3A-like isoform X2 [Anneissia japonica]|uniref:serine/threonine-protein phosphatase 4 regulatory subunit 3A-like isoform X2 n=1 Tax=Anneissia japonica TaxID=1529436 RepID=UPI001425A259|nr:serine/threonine-protein phosphatase 4 regulatory subunit 3A-like isoform X2 [Anneissia japonica]
MADTRRRVKLYVLNDERQWDDRGTGHVSSSYVERLNGMSLLVRAESDGSILLESKIEPDTAYQKQQETLIVWSENENCDLALSFQEKAGCDEIWQKICEVQGKDPSVDITQDIVEESEDERFDEMPDAAPPIELPLCELSRLEEISELFSSVLPSPIKREKLALAIENDNYVKRLLELFHVCEDLENMEGLHHLYEIFKDIFLLNKNSLLEMMFSEDSINAMLGVLEYDPSLSTPYRHREYLSSKSRFKEVIPITNRELLNKIHQTYRVQYIQDTILPTPSVFEENMLSALNSFIFFNKIEIVTMIQDDEKFLPELFSQLMDENTDDEKRQDLVLFLKEFCMFAQTCQNRDAFFKMLSALGLLPALGYILQNMEEPVVRQAATDILAYIVEFSPTLVREFILDQRKQQTDDDILLMNVIIEQMICDTDEDLGGAIQLMNLIRILLDPENMMGSITLKTEKTEFLSFFYKHCIHVLTAPLMANTATLKPSKDDYQTAHLLSIIMDLLTFCVEHHTYHAKNHIISKDLLRRILALLKSQHAFLNLCAVRCMRRIISLKDDFYNRYIIKGKLFEPLVNAFLSNGNKYNLLNSAILDLFEFVRIEDIKLLIVHMMEEHGSAFKNIDYVKTFQGLHKKYEQLKDRETNKPDFDGLRQPSSFQNSRYRRDARALDEEEEMWFDQDDEQDPAVIPEAVASLPEMSVIIDSIAPEEKETIAEPKEMDKENFDNSNTNGRPNSPVKCIPIEAETTITPTPVLTNKTVPTSTSAEVKSSSLTRKGGLVDYPDEDSDEDSDEDLPVSKRPRLAT